MKVVLKEFVSVVRENDMVADKGGAFMSPEGGCAIILEMYSMFDGKTEYTARKMSSGLYSVCGWHVKRAWVKAFVADENDHTERSTAICMCPDCKDKRSDSAKRKKRNHRLFVVDNGYTPYITHKMERLEELAEAALEKLEVISDEAMAATFHAMLTYDEWEVQRCRQLNDNVKAHAEYCEGLQRAMYKLWMQKDNRKHLRCAKKPSLIQLVDMFKGDAKAIAIFDRVCEADATLTKVRETLGNDIKVVII